MRIKIKEAAKKFKGWSLYKLAAQMGVKQQTLYSWAKGETRPGYESFDRLCSYLGCGIQDLLEPEPVPTPSYKTIIVKEGETL